MHKTQNVKEAIRKFGELLGKKGQQVVCAIPYNEHRHYLVITHEGGRYYCTFKREVFKTYEWKFDVVRGEGGKGAGESLNTEFLDKAIQLGAQYIVFIYQDGKAYGITPQEFKKHGNERETDIYGERTISVPMQKLTNMEDLLNEKKEIL